MTRIRTRAQSSSQLDDDVFETFEHEGTPVSQYIRDKGLLDTELLQLLIEQVSPCNSWVLDCASFDCDDLRKSSVFLLLSPPKHGLPAQGPPPGRPTTPICDSLFRRLWPRKLFCKLLCRWTIQLMSNTYDKMGYFLNSTMNWNFSSGFKIIVVFMQKTAFICVDYDRMQFHEFWIRRFWRWSW